MAQLKVQRKFAEDARNHGAAGDGSTDDTTALSTALAAAETQGGPLILAPGTYSLATWSEYRNTSPLTIVAEKPGTAVLVGPGSGSFLGPDSDLHLYGVSVEDFATPILLDTEEDIEYLHVEKCRFTDFTRGIYGASSVTGSVKNAIIMGNYFGSGAAGGIEMQHSALESAIVSGNIIENLTRAGTVRGIMLGQNSALPSGATRGRFVVSNNILRSLVSTGEFEVQGILVYGERVVIEGNQLEDVTSEAETGCEGIYTKCRHSVIQGNILKDAGQYQAAINVKGARRSEGDDAVSPGYAINCSNNMIWFTGDTRPGGTNGIVVETDEVIVEGNQVHGCIGNPIHVRYPLNAVVRGNTLTRCDAGVMIRVEPYSELSVGDTVIVDGNLIADITRTSGNIQGIGITNGYTEDLVNVFIRGNVMRRFTTSGNVWGIVIQTSSGDINNVWIEDNVVPSESARGINLTGANAIDEIVIRNNDLRCSGDPIASFATVTNHEIRGNLGTNTRRKLRVTVSNGATASSATSYATPSYARAVQDRDVMAMPAGDLGSATKWWVVPGATTFTINLDQDPGQNVTFNVWVDLETTPV